MNSFWLKTCLAVSLIINGGLVAQAIIGAPDLYCDVRTGHLVCSDTDNLPEPGHK